MDNITIILLGIAAWIAAFLIVWAFVAGAAIVSEDRPRRLSTAKILLLLLKGQPIIHHPLTKNHWK